MRRRIAVLSAGLLLVLAADRAHNPYLGLGHGPFPSDWFAAQRAWPLDAIPQEKVAAAIERARFDRATAELTTNGTPLTWVNVGPYNIGGRITAIAAPPGGVRVYTGAANGGVWRSDNSGDNWSPIFDAFGVYSIGALALHPSNQDILYVGTGEANSSVDSYDGAGLFRTADGGTTWEHLGLATTARIARVALDPSNPQRVFVAAMGRQFSTGPDRGLYKSEDAGATWSKVLFVNDSTGVCDVVFNPAHPETMFAATWERVRRPTYRRAYGPGCGIWRSVNSGFTWTRLASGLPAPSDNVGRIGLAIAPSRPSTVYAQIITGAAAGYVGLGLYRTDNGGTTWVRRDGSGFTSIFGGFGWYFGDVAVDPTNAETVYAQGVSLVRSINGGINFSSITGSAHVDQHGLWIDPSNSLRLYLVNDGGFYSSDDGAASWTKSVDLPITQFYAGTVDPTNAARIFGGTQDNNTLRTQAGPNAWTAILGGDGFYCAVDPTNPSVVFSEFQYCCSGTGPRRSSVGGPSGIVPSGFNTSDRYNWSTPFVIHPNNHNLLLCGSNRVYRSLDNGFSYSVISEDLTTIPAAALVYGTITTLDISPVDGNLYYAGTDDGQVWRSPNAGAVWENITLGLPERSVTRVTADPTNSNVVYVTHSGFGLDEHLAHVHRSDNRGTTWQDISGGLPDVPVNDILVDPTDPQTLFIASDIGVYATRNLGAGWFPLGQGMPLQAVFDLTYHAGARALFAATHGRSQWRLDLASLPVAVAPGAAGAGLALSAPAPNPSRGEARFTVDLAMASDLDVAVFDAAGRRVAELHRGRSGPGRTALAWDGHVASGRVAGPGVYFVRALAGGIARTQRLVRVE